MWNSSNESVVKIEAKGLCAKIIAIKPGESTVSVTIDGKTAICPVSVKKGKFILTKTNNNTLIVKGFDKTTINVTNIGNEKNVKFTSSNTNVAVVNEKGVVTGINTGVVKIIVENDNAVGECEVAVKKNKNVELGQKIVDYAKKYLGVKYQLSQRSFEAIDCSGLVQCAYSQYGYQLPRRANEQERCGESVKLENIQVGDLVFYSSLGPNGSVTHVAIFYGDEKIIHATPPKVMISSMYRNYLVSIKRII